MELETLNNLANTMLLTGGIAAGLWLAAAIVAEALHSLRRKKTGKLDHPMFTTRLAQSGEYLLIAGITWTLAIFIVGVTMMTIDSTSFNSQMWTFLPIAIVGGLSVNYAFNKIIRKFMGPNYSN